MGENRNQYTKGLTRRSSLLLLRNIYSVVCALYADGDIPVTFEKTLEK
jgi:hypothetical protein